MCAVSKEMKDSQNNTLDTFNMLTENRKKKMTYNVLLKKNVDVAF